jgi:serine/threonine protein kinase
VTVALVHLHHSMHLFTCTTRCTCSPAPLDALVHSTVLRSSRRGRPVFDAIKLARELAVAMCHLQSLNPPIVHRDIKSLNILLVEDKVGSQCSECSECSQCSQCSSVLKSIQILTTVFPLSALRCQPPWSYIRWILFTTRAPRRSALARKWLISAMQPS